jgi:hypothetical protein
MKLSIAHWHGNCFVPSVMKKTSTILAITSGLFFGQAQAEIESEFHVGYNSEYIYRGVELGKDAYEYGLDFAGSSDSGLDWSAGIWSISPDGEDGNVDELDIYASVSKDLGIGSVAAGFTVYTYDGGATDDAEVYLGFSTQSCGVDLGLTVFYGTDGAIQDQVLLEGTIGYSFEVDSKTTANIGIAYGYMLDEGLAGNYSNDDGEVYASATISLDYAVSDTITFSPYISYIEGEDNRIANAADGVIGGASVSFSF